MTIETKETIKEVQAPCQSEIRAMRHTLQLMGKCYQYHGNKDGLNATDEAKYLNSLIGQTYLALSDYCKRHPLAKRENLYNTGK